MECSNIFQNFCRSYSLDTVTQKAASRSMFFPFIKGMLVIRITKMAKHRCSDVFLSMWKYYFSAPASALEKHEAADLQQEKGT